MGQSSCSCFVPWDLSKYIVVGELERCFLNLLISGAFVPNRIWDALKQQSQIQSMDDTSNRSCPMRRCLKLTCI